jgi:hypothetical protein
MLISYVNKKKYCKRHLNQIWGSHVTFLHVKSFYLRFSQAWTLGVNVKLAGRETTHELKMTSDYMEKTVWLPNSFIFYIFCIQPAYSCVQTKIKITYFLFIKTCFSFILHLKIHPKTVLIKNIVFKIYFLRITTKNIYFFI